METKKDELIARVHDSNELELIDRNVYCYVAESVLRTWKEDFINEDNGETVTIERTNLLYPRGQRLDYNDFSALLFHFQSGDIKELALSNQQRNGFVVEKGWWSVWEVKAVATKTKLNILLYADNITTAYDIVKDYIELNYRGDFKINSIKKAEQSIIINKEYSNHVLGFEKEREWYSVSILAAVTSDEHQFTFGPYSYVVSADTADDARLIVEEHFAEKRAEKGETDPYTITMQSANTINCNVIIPEEFCLAYKPQQES